MQKNKNRLSGAVSQQHKPQVSKPKPEWTTDFTDYSKYKLSESQMIQKKASLQSKHREEAKQLVQQRRKKLEMGIVDEQTRKVYETALISKNIDINPPIRKNLSQMIQYQREMLDQKRKDADPNQDDNQGDSDDGQQDEDQKKYDNQLKETQAFIKKFERAKKQDKIERAVNILTEDDHDQKKEKSKQNLKINEKPRKTKDNLFQNQKIKSQNILDYKNSSMSMSQNHEEALSSIEQTIKFMEERLFSSKRISSLKKQEDSQSSIKIKSLKEQTLSLQPENQSNFHQNSKNFHEDMLELSQLKMNPSQSRDQDDDECMDTIRRMREMIQSKEHLYSNLDISKQQKENVRTNNERNQEDHRSTLSKKGQNFLSDSDAEVDFSLTNNSAQFQEQLCNKNSECYSGNFGRTGQIDLYDEEYERVKKSLFEQVNRLQIQCANSIDQTSFQAKTSFNDRSNPIQDSGLQNHLAMQLKCSTIKKPFIKKGNMELQKIRNQIAGTKNTVDNLKVEQLHLPKSPQVMGFDFRGSINIKKNVILK